MAKKRRVAPGPRSVIALLLIGFVLATSGVIFRRVLGVSAQTELRRLTQQRNALEAERIRLESAIRDASSRQRLQPLAEQRLNMHIPTADQQAYLPPVAPRTPPKTPDRREEHD